MINELLKTKKELRFKNGKLKIAMFSDLHGCTNYDPKLKRNLDAAIEKIKPDIVLLGGDIIGGNDGCATLDELRTYLSEITEVLEKNNIPWAHVYGNHDRESFPNAVQQEIYESFPNCVSKAGPEDLDGTGNYFLPVKATEGDEVIFGIWGLDSHSGIGDRHPNLKQSEVILPNNFGCTFYDHVGPDQVTWYYDSSKALEAHFGRKIPSLMYFHIPIPEYLLITRNPERTGMTGEAREGICCCEFNYGLFSAALLRADVKAIFCGHEHINDFCGEYCGIKLGYDGGMGYNTYWNADMLGGRVFEIDEKDPWNINTYMFKMTEIFSESELK